MAEGKKRGDSLIIKNPLGNEKKTTFGGGKDLKGLRGDFL